MTARGDSSEAAAPACRFCRAPLVHTFVDLGMSPLCQRHVRPDELDRMEPFYPLHVRVCATCFLVQLAEVVRPEEIFRDYAYFSSYSDTALAHAETYCRTMRDRLGLGPESLVVELASNDGYLLQFFHRMGLRVVGVEPAANVAEAAVAKGIPTVTAFFGTALARRLAAEARADLIVANNVLAHVPDIVDFVAGIRILLAPGGIATAEFPHLLRLIDDNLFDTIYHEHFSYLSFTVAEAIFTAAGLVLFDVEEVPTHGGSLRIHARHRENAALPVQDRVRDRLRLERARGLASIATYEAFPPKVAATKRKLLSFLIEAKAGGKSIAGYGAPGKGATLLNYCGIGTDFVDYTVDRNPVKQGNYMPGVRIPIVAPGRIRETQPDYLLVLPWNLTDEIVAQNAHIRDWGGRFVVPLPEPRVLP